MGYYKNQLTGGRTSQIVRGGKNSTMQQPNVDVSQVSKAIKELGVEISNKELTMILEKHAMIFVDAAKQNLYAHQNVVSGATADSIGIIRRRGGRWVPRTIVGPRYYGKHKGMAAHLIEYGTAERFRSIGNKHGLTNKKIKQQLLKQASTGVMPAQPFMRPAFDENRERVTNLIMSDILDLIIEKSKKLGLNAA